MTRWCFTATEIADSCRWSGARGTVNRRLRREVQDLPIWGRIGATDCRMERLLFVEPGHGVTRRYARFISQLAQQ
ncbi:hypothetical protein [Salinisphaera sp. LB1]|uniref:hypothetical protein n=1 Tax=Salinisphaera sp. LB1 TaxID=2183911 RepID=UPI000D707877|nr:hypothetical protein [Salinisphaera sp. LB1]AWN16199.1 Mobile element protein [Salinisphaera sp. LB1]